MVSGGLGLFEGPLLWHAPGLCIAAQISPKRLQHQNSGNT